MSDRYSLPPIARTLRRLCGIQGLCALVQRYRGQQLYIPSLERTTVAHPIAQAVGLEAAQRLAEELGGTRITIPLCLGSLRAERDMEIWRRYMGGESASRIARDYGMLWRSVQKVTRRVRLRGGAPAKEARHAGQLSFGWPANPIVGPPTTEKPTS